MQKKKQTKPIKQIIFYIVLILIVLLITFSEDIIKLANKNSINLAENGDTQTTINPSNSPYFVAGMIPIKWETDHFVITTKNDPNWYDYEGGKPAYVMLNDGYYRSEIERGVEPDQLMENNVGVGVPDDPSTRGTILMWIPRFAINNETNDIKYIQGIGKANEAWTIPDMFTHKQEETMPDFLLTGIWFETDVDTNYANKIATMNTKDSIYGFIANTKALASDQTTGNEIENYINKLFTDTGTDDQWSPLQSEETTNTTNKIDNTNTNVGASIARPQIADITNPNRVILHIINQKNQDPIKAKVSYNKDTGLIDVQVTYTQYGIEKILYENTQQLTLEKNGRQATASTEGISVEAGDRTITIIDKAGNTKEILVEVIPAIYVTFYPSDGTLAFANKKNPLPDKGTYTTYEDISESEWSSSSQIPWFSVKSNIRTVEFVDKIKPISTAFWFNSCTNLSQINYIKENLNTSQVIDMHHMFSYCSNLTSFNLSSFDTSNVVDMSYIFAYCTGLTALDLSSFNTRNVINMGNMFRDCSNLSELDLSNFDTSNVTNMQYMFCNCTGLTSLDLTNFDTSNVTNMSYMFYNCTGLTQITFGDNWNKEVTLPDPTQDGYTCSGWYSDAEFTNKVAEAGANYTPAGAITIYAQMVQNIYATLYTDGTLGFASNTSTISGKTKQYGPWNISNQTGNMPWYNYRTSIKTVEFVDKIKPISTARWFSGCNNLTQINHMKENLDTSNVTNMYMMFYKCPKLPSLDLSSFDTSNVTDMSYMFTDSSGLNWINLSSFNTSNVTNMNSMFMGYMPFTSLDLSSFDTSNVTNMSYMFGYCSKLTSLDVSNFDTSNVTNMNSMFINCSSLTSLDVSNFNTSNVTDMNNMFRDCSHLTSLDLTNFDTNNITTMSNMFANCSGLTSLDVSNFNTSNVTNMGYMFYACSSLTSLDVNNFNTCNVTNMAYMFHNCSGLTSLDVSNFNTCNVTNMNSMFRACSKLKTIYVGPNWKLANNRTDMFYGCGTNTTTLKK